MPPLYNQDDRPTVDGLAVAKDSVMIVPSHTGVGTTMVLSPIDPLERERKVWWPA